MSNGSGLFPPNPVPVYHNQPQMLGASGITREVFQPQQANSTMYVTQDIGEFEVRMAPGTLKEGIIPT